MMRVAELLPAATPAGRAAEEVVREFSSSALVNHCVRSFLWAAGYARANGIAYDEELLYVAALLHDLGLVAAFDNHAVPFEDAGGNVAWVFGAGAGWPADRRRRVHEVIVRHMWDEVDVREDPEGHLLELATGLDISGRNAAAWPEDFRREVLEAYPRLDLAEQFTACFRDQAQRKPRSTAAAAVASGIAGRIAANPLERM
jgi:hypothetical protein